MKYFLLKICLFILYWVSYHFKKKCAKNYMIEHAISDIEFVLFEKVSE